MKKDNIKKPVKRTIKDYLKFWKGEKKQMKKSVRGITLIALVITIIILLILAGVTIATLTGENGLLRKGTKCSRRK